MTKLRIHLISLGGTISMTGDSSAGVLPTLTARDLLGSADAGVELVVTTETFRTLPGAHLTVDDLIGVQRRVAAALDGGAAGVVVVQGTDTIDETAFLLDVLHNRSEPLIVTGAMRPPQALGADGPANLRDSLIAAATPELRGAGALVCLGTEIHAARYVRKLHTFNPAAFGSPLVGPVGWVIEDKATLLSRLPQPTRIDADKLQEGVPWVALHRVTLGDDGRQLTVLPSLGAQGLVVEAFGAGHLPPAVAEAAERLNGAFPVAVCSRVGTGQTLRNTYGFPGSERDLLHRGLLPAGLLDGPRTRLLLTLALQAGESRDTAASRLLDWGGADGE